MPDFIIVIVCTKKLDLSSLEIIIINTKKSALLLSGLMFGARSTSYAKTLIGLHLANMKVIAIFSIFCRSAYPNNSNYLYFLLHYIYILLVQELMSSAF